MDGQSQLRGPKTYPLEGYLGKSIVLQESIFSEDISKNIPNSVYVNSLFGDNIWGVITRKPNPGRDKVIFVKDLLFLLNWFTIGFYFVCVYYHYYYNIIHQF